MHRDGKKGFCGGRCDCFFLKKFGGIGKICSLDCAKKRKRGETEVRKVRVGKIDSSKYPPNLIVTSKYTIWNFIPKNLFEQFRRIANFYFLFVTLISFAVDGPVGYVTTLLPLMFVVFVTAIKQGYEDYIRHRADRELNNSVVCVFRDSCLQKLPSRKIKVGDIIKIREDEDIPCDIILLVSSNKTSKCYVTTSNLDGETNLKSLYCPRSLKGNVTTEGLKYLDATIECEEPTPDLYKFNGRIEFSKRTSEILKRTSVQRQNSYRLERLTLLDEGNGDSNGGSRHPSSTGQTKPMTDDSDTGANGFMRNVGGKGGLSGVGQHLRNTVQNLPGYRGDPFPLLHGQEWRTGPIALTTFKPDPGKNETLPKSAFAKHKKSYSNVTNLTLDPAFVESLALMKRSFNRRGSNKENLVDPLTAENLLLKGSTLKNTEFVYGCAVYTGQETKMALNSQLTRNKFSVVEKSINKFLVFQLGLLIAVTVASTILKCTIEIKTGSLKFRSLFVAEMEPQEQQESSSSIFKDLFGFFMVYNYLLPISLYVTLEMTKFLGALLFKWDLHLYDKDEDRPALSNTSDLNEELGEVEYLFTDKTGTLTENNLRFHSCSIDGVPYREIGGRLYRIEDDDSLAEEPLSLNFGDFETETELFLLALTLCNTVQVVVTGGEEPFRYSATSPDEKALVEAMQRMNIVYANDEDFAIIEVGGSTKIFQRLEVLEFTSRRKRMSVIVKDEEGNISLFCKGAESAILPKVIQGRSKEILQQVSSFAKKGLRTLVVGYKPLTDEEYQLIEEKLQKARETLSSDREDILHNTYGGIECDLILLGATGVEDQLQEGVQDTLRSLRLAGIKVWMLTGDKEETAVQISLSCGHFRNGMERICLTGITTKAECENSLLGFKAKVNNETRDIAMVVDGASLQLALDYAPELFRSVCVKCEAVVCCRLSPIQKSMVVSLVKNRKKAPIVAAIGDGANDVSMIKEAHIGLGIMGKEGRQAVLCSDFAFAKFRFLKRALLVHGHWYYVRTANLILYFFYKNIVFIMPQFYFFFLAGYSAQQLYDSSFYVSYNTILTSLPVLIYGVFEQNHPDQSLLNSPAMYMNNRKNNLMTWKSFGSWLLFGAWHSFIVFIVPTLFYLVNSYSIHHGCAQQYGTIIFHNSVLVVNLKLMLHSRFWSTYFVGSIFLSILLLYAVSIIYSSIYIPQVNDAFYWTFNYLAESLNYWLLCLVTCAAALIPDFLMYYLSTFTRIPFHGNPR